MKDYTRPTHCSNDVASAARYSSDIDMMAWARLDYGDDFAQYLQENCLSAEFMARLASMARVEVVCVAGSDGTGWLVRVSLADIDEHDYDALWVSIRSIMCQYYAAYVVCGRA